MPENKTTQPDVPYGICPYISTAIPIQGQLPNKDGLFESNQPTIHALALKTPCLGPECQLWDNDRSCCSLRPIRRKEYHEKLDDLLSRMLKVFGLEGGPIDLSGLKEDAKPKTFDDANRD